MATTEACFLCRRRVKPTERRTLFSSDKGRKFLETFVGVSASHFQPPQQHYLCKPCLRKLESGQTIVNDLQQLVTKCRQHFGLPCVLIKASSEEESDSEGADTASDEPSAAESDGELNHVQLALSSKYTSKTGISHYEYISTLEELPNRLILFARRCSVSKCQKSVLNGIVYKLYRNTFRVQSRDIHDEPLSAEKPHPIIILRVMTRNFLTI